jgi:hypothetical protein
MDQIGRRTTSVSRRLVQWRAQHDNGWATIIAERPDHSFAAWVMTDRDCSAVYIDPDIHRACAAVMSFLYWKTGHRHCTEECSDWCLQEFAPP